MESYNGWTNYETWNVNLWSLNDQSTHDYVMDNRPYTPAKAERIASELYPKGTPDMDDVTEMDAVNWDETADAWNED